MTSLSENDAACLRAAAPRGLIRRMLLNPVLPGSAWTDVGWWARASWSMDQPDHSAGGPWSLERVFDLCERGFLGIGAHEDRFADITKAGRKALKTHGAGWPQCLRAGGITHDEALAAVRRLIAGAFRRDGEQLAPDHRPRFSIPCNPDRDDDTLIMTYIGQQMALNPDGPLGPHASGSSARSEP